MSWKASEQVSWQMGQMSKSLGSSDIRSHLLTWIAFAIRGRLVLCSSGSTRHVLIRLLREATQQLRVNCTAAQTLLRRNKAYELPSKGRSQSRRSSTRISSAAVPDTSLPVLMNAVPRPDRCGKPATLCAPTQITTVLFLKFDRLILASSSAMRSSSSSPETPLRPRVNRLEVLDVLMLPRTPLRLTRVAEAVVGRRFVLDLALSSSFSPSSSSPNFFTFKNTNTSSIPSY